MGDDNRDNTREVLRRPLERVGRSYDVAAAIPVEVAAVRGAELRGAVARVREAIKDMDRNRFEELTVAAEPEADRVAEQTPFGAMPTSTPNSAAAPSQVDLVRKAMERVAGAYPGE